MNASVPPVPSRTSANTINTGIFISTSLTVVPDTVQVNRWADEPEMNAQKFLEEPQPVTPCFAAVRAEGVSTVVEGRSLRGSGAEPSTRCAGLGIWLRGSTEAGTKISA
jgi:hypothetical protein